MILSAISMIFSAACDELRHIQWVPLSEARGYPLPFITELVLAEVEEIAKGRKDAPIPFFNHGASGGSFVPIP